MSAGHSITVSYGYDLDGNQTALTDGNGNTTYTTYNSLGLPADHHRAPDRRLHQRGQLHHHRQSTTATGTWSPRTCPAACRSATAYDAEGDLTSQSGSGAGAPTATRTFTYDAAGRMLTAATSAAGTPGSVRLPAGHLGVVQLRRPRPAAVGVRVGRAPPASPTTAAGSSTSATDAAGTSTLHLRQRRPAGHRRRRRLRRHRHLLLQQPGPGHQDLLRDRRTTPRAFGYDSLHRLISDTVNTASGAQVAAIGYGYDADNDVTSMTTSGLATAGGGTGTVTNTYGYDEASRLTSWTATPAGGHRPTQDLRLRQQRQPDQPQRHHPHLRRPQRADLRRRRAPTPTPPTATWPARPAPGGTTSYTSDAYGQQITDAASSLRLGRAGPPGQRRQPERRRQRSR